MSYKGLIECLREGIEYDPSFSEVQHANETMDKAADKIIKQAVQLVKLQARNLALEDALRDAPAALNAMAAQVEAEWRDHDKAAARHDLVVQTFIKKVRDALESQP